MSKSSLPWYCTLCNSTCGTRYEVENDRIAGVTNNHEHPTGAAMCVKGKAATELVDSTERLRTPMRRTRPKCSANPGWEATSWGEARAEIAGRLTSIKAELGAEAVALSLTTPSGTPVCDSCEWIERLVYKYRSPNVCYATKICDWQKAMAYAFTFGCGLPTPDFISADLIILWGHNPASTWLA
ncbi:molybdopterin-dependent oxidoreductase [Pseudomonas fluorescens]|uniref:molybdopterin-dependent oxidoreductase n=1 Tax=Pseudomonas fluorescens TaxID=294 RepID=UPI000CD19541|nr:hypothetical protein C1751_01760 [Pseudomonas fluorescens]